MPEPPTKIDRGFVEISTDRDGRKWVRICQSMSSDSPPKAHGIFAIYKRWTNVRIQGVPTGGNARRLWTTQPAEVYLELETNTVVINPVSSF